MKLHDAPRYVKQMVLDRLTGQSRDRLLTNEQRGEACMQAAFAYIDGFVGNPDFQLGLRWINEAAQHDYIPVLGVAYRLLQACAQPLSEEEKQAVQRWLFSAACVGSSTASQDLKLLDFNGYTEAREKSKTQYYLPGVEVMEKSPEDIDRRVLSSGRLQEFGREFYMRDTGSIATQLERLVNDHGDTFLHCSVVYGSELPDLITYLKTSPSNIDARNKDGNTALLLAMQLGFHEKAKALLCAGADPTISNELGQTPCHWIIHIDASSDPGELLDSLIMKNANLQACAQKETDVRHYSFAAVVGTPLHWAVCQGRLDLVRCFLDRGADPLFQYQQQTPVDLAVSLHYWQILELLLSRPPRPVESTMHLKRSHAWLKQPGERSSASNWVGLAVQTFPPHVRMILHGNSFLTAFRQTLDTLDRAGLIDQTMFHPFQAAAIDNKIDLLQTIFSMWQRAGSGEEVTFLYSLLGSVISQIMQEPALFLLDKLDDACLSATMPDMSPILLSYVASLNADPIVLHRLLGYVDDVDIRNEQGYTPFAIAVRSRNYEIATELLGVGADPDLLFRAGNSDSNVLKVNILHDFIVADNDLSLFPLQYLLEPQHPFKDRVPSFLVDTELGYTALHVAALWKARSVFGYILNKFGDPTSINAKANDGWTALHMAAHCGHYDHAKRLCEKGALLDVEVEMIGEDVPYTPLDMCNNPNRHWTNWPSNNVYWEEVFLSRLRTFEYLKSEGGYSRRHTYLPLHVRFLRCAVFQGLGNLFVEALKRELDPIMRQQFLNALLFHSSKFGDVGMVERLLLAGADVHDRSAKGRTPLHIAAKHNKVHVVRSLFKAGADLHVKDLEGRSAFKEAFLSTCHSAQSLLLAYGAEKEYAGNEERMLAISQASEARQRAQFRYDWKSRKEERKIEVNPGETFRDQWAPYTTQDGISKRKRMRPPFS
jgi:ankyrin repeat protein